MLTPLGQMRDPVVILTPARSTDTSGGEEITYTAGNPIFIALRATTTTEALQFGQISADVTHIAFGHWGDLQALTAKHRVRLYEDADVEFDIAGDPINSPKRAWARLNLVLRANG